MPKSPRRRRFAATEGRRFSLGDSRPTPDGTEEPPAESMAAFDEAQADAPIDDSEAEDLPDGESGHREQPPTAPNDLPPAFQLVKTPRARAAKRRRFPLPVLVWTALLTLGLGLLGGFFLPHAAPEPRPQPPAPELPRTLTPDDQAELDAAYAARHDGKLAEARKLFEALANKKPSLAALEVEVGRTLLYGGQNQESAVVLRAAIDRGYRPAEANLLLGVLYKRQKNYDVAEERFANAVALDPTQPDYYYFWGECLRDEGKLAEAIPKFRTALLRNQYETATGLYRLKLWLCEIEADQAKGNGTDAEIDTALAQPLPPMEAYFAAAARDLQTANNFPAAVEHLAKARQRADPVVFAVTMQDPVFAPISTRPEFAAFFHPPDKPVSP